MLTLGIETSCDETAVALVHNGQLLGQILASQEAVHALFGGVVPEIASREHYRILGPLFEQLMRQHGLVPDDLDVVAVARGPGLLGSLLTGLGFGKGLVLGTGALLVGVDHLQAHLLAPGLEGELRFPALGLLVSGGHTHLYRMGSHTRFTRLGRTLDDAAGEALDKSARLMGLPYPGGRFIDALAQAGQVDAQLFPRPYLDNQNLDFSFSGLKTAVATLMRSRPHLLECGKTLAGETPDAARLAERAEGDTTVQELAGVCASLNHSVADTLRVKTQRALKTMPGKQEVRALIVAGGVAANSMLRQAMQELARTHGLELFLPSLSLCTDNAAMVAYAGERRVLAGQCHSLELEAVPRGRRVPEDFIAADACRKGDCALDAAEAKPCCGLDCA